MKYTGPADPTTPCDQCAGPTYTFASGSIWCPSEDCEPGGHFVRRVAFERKPGRESNVSAGKGAGARAPKATPKLIKPQPIKPRFGGGYDDFVKGEDR